MELFVHVLTFLHVILGHFFVQSNMLYYCVSIVISFWLQFRFPCVSAHVNINIALIFIYNNNVSCILFHMVIHLVYIIYNCVIYLVRCLLLVCVSILCVLSFIFVSSMSQFLWKGGSWSLSVLSSHLRVCGICWKG